MEGWDSEGVGGSYDGSCLGWWEACDSFCCTWKEVEGLVCSDRVAYGGESQLVLVDTGWFVGVDVHTNVDWGLSSGGWGVMGTYLGLDRVGWDWAVGGVIQAVGPFVGVGSAWSSSIKICFSSICCYGWDSVASIGLVY